VISKPSADSFNIGYIILLADVLFHSSAMIFKKKLMYTQSSLLTVYINLIILLPISFILSGFDYKFLFDMNILKIGLFISLIYITEFCMTHLAYKMSDASTLQPVRFFKIIYAVIISYLLLNERPTIEQVIGSCLIICANILLIRFDYKRKK
jgi:drug/metabolite transporter (DMT)-like permease